MIFDTDNDDLAQKVEAQACAAFKINSGTLEEVTFRQSLTETLQVTLVPGDIVCAYEAAKALSGPLSANFPFVFELDAQFISCSGKTLFRANGS